MKRKDWFIVGMKLLGVWLLISFVDEARMALEVHLGMLDASRTPVAVYWIHAGTDLLLGVYLLSGAPLLASWAFPRKDHPSCTECGYDLTGNTSGACPECGEKAG